MKLKIRSKNIRKKFVYVDLLENKQANQAIIFMSGFSGSSVYPLFKSAAKFFYSKGYSVIRFNFCNDRDEVRRKDAIKMEEMRMAFYANEIKNVIDTLGDKYLRIILVGHSFGAIASILFLSKFKSYKKRIDIVLWDPSLLPWKREWMEEDFAYDAKKNLYREKHSGELFNKKFYNECIGIKDTAETFGKLKISSCIIAAKGVGEKNAEKYFTKVSDKDKSEFKVINGTDHAFKGKKPQANLFVMTHRYLE